MNAKRGAGSGRRRPESRLVRSTAAGVDDLTRQSADHLAVLHHATARVDGHARLLAHELGRARREGRRGHEQEERQGHEEFASLTVSLFSNCRGLRSRSGGRDQFRMGRTNPLRGAAEIRSASGASSRTEKAPAAATPEITISGVTIFFDEIGARVLAEGHGALFAIRRAAGARENDRGAEGNAGHPQDGEERRDSRAPAHAVSSTRARLPHSRFGRDPSVAR